MRFMKNGQNSQSYYPLLAYLTPPHPFLIPFHELTFILPGLSILPILQDGNRVIRGFYVKGNKLKQFQ